MEIVFNRRAVRIGELLLRDGLVTSQDLARALADQRYVGKRLGSLLVTRGLVDLDDVARALGELRGVPAALTKHFENRDRELERELPAHLARAHGALPLGRQRDGTLVICVRDPGPSTQALLERATRQAVLVTTACAHLLEPLLEAAYPNVPPPPSDFAVGTQRNTIDEYEVDLSTGPIPTSFALAALDDDGVDKQFTLQTPRTTTLLPQNAPPASPKK